MAESKDTFDQAQVLEPLLKLVADISMALGVKTTELEILVRVAYLRRLAETIPIDPITGRGPSHEAIGLSAGIHRNEVQSLLGHGTRSAAARLRKRRQRHFKSDRVLSLWKKNYLSNSGLPLNLPFDFVGDAKSANVSFAALVRKALPGHLPKNALKELTRRGLVQLLPDGIIRYRPGVIAAADSHAEPTAGLEFVVQQLTLLGKTLLQRQRTTVPHAAPTDLAIYVPSAMMSSPADHDAATQTALLELINSFLHDCQIRINPKLKTKSKRAERKRMFGLSVFTWQP